jgi:hypothetical protein
VDFWNQFDRNSLGKKRSVSTVMKVFFSKKQKSEPSKIIKSTAIKPTIYEDIEITSCPPGLYCVIDEFITEYDLRLLEEEERAEIVAKKGAK